VLLNHRRALRVTAWLLAATVAVFLLVGTDPNRGFVQDIDDAFHRLMVSAQVGPLVWLAKAVSFVGSVWVNWPLRVLVMIVLGIKRRWLQLSAFVLAVMSSELLIGAMKDLYARPRAADSLIGTSGFSFPSGHAVAGAVTAVGIVVCLLPPGPRRWRWEFQAVFFAVLMALSRTYLGAHWLSDVIGGGLLGATLAIGFPAVLQELRERWQNRPTPSPSASAGRSP
jgi:undecaprenyl-diphosphatase